RDLFERGSAWLDANLFNGEYYEQEIRPPENGQLIAEGLRTPYGARDLRDPDYQVGPGCLVDQLVGQFVAHVCGLGHLLDREHVRTTLESIYKYNFREDLYGYFNHFRTFALNDEAAMVMCSFPRGGRPKTPVHFYSEVMTGFEYAASVHMLYEGLTDMGLRCISAIRARYDGLRRNPFDEAECGHHYARAMASWAAVLALTGFHYSGVERSMTFANKVGTHFWSNGYAWGTCEMRQAQDSMNVTLSVLHGALRLRRFIVTGIGQVGFPDLTEIAPGKSRQFEVRASG
ncbi:MAG TPA: GH116 family glycosyl hydrolase, partial [Anaerolineae bacterium]|nr:GH116 family glycosyl hydrolase [Anaerolineae bacterium]